jgi:hypothetical protein
MSDFDASSPLIPFGPGPEEESFVQRKMQLEKEAEERTRRPAPLALASWRNVIASNGVRVTLTVG